MDLKEGLGKVLEPPSCPNCGSTLYNVTVEEHSRYLFDVEEGKYEKAAYGDIVVRCINCMADISEVFPEGIINFIVRKR